MLKWQFAHERMRLSYTNFIKEKKNETQIFPFCFVRLRDAVIPDECLWIFRHPHGDGDPVTHEYIHADLYAHRDIHPDKNTLAHCHTECHRHRVRQSK